MTYNEAIAEGLIISDEILLTTEFGSGTILSINKDADLKAVSYYTYVVKDGISLISCYNSEWYRLFIFKLEVNEKYYNVKLDLTETVNMAREYNKSSKIKISRYSPLLILCMFIVCVVTALILYVLIK